MDKETDHIMPQSTLWTHQGIDPRNNAWIYDHLDGTRILSSIDDVTNEGLNYHVSVSRNAQRMSLVDAREVLAGLDASFPPEQWHEDNHGSGIARHFWAHVDPAKRRPCPCAANEKPNVEGDYTWREAPGEEKAE